MLLHFLTFIVLNSFVSCDLHSQSEKRLWNLVVDTVKHYQKDETVFCDLPDSEKTPQTAVNITDALEFIVSTKELAKEAKEKFQTFENQIQNIETAEKTLDDGLNKEILLLKAFLSNTKDLQTEIANDEQENNLRKLIKYANDHLAIRKHMDLQKTRVDEFYNLLQNDWQIKGKVFTEFYLVAVLLEHWKVVVAETIAKLGFPKDEDVEEAKKTGCKDDSYLKESLQIHKLLETMDRNSLPTIEKVLKDKTAKLPGYIRQRCSCLHNVVKEMAQQALNLSARIDKLQSRVSTCGEANMRRDNLRKEYWKVAQVVETWVISKSKRKDTKKDEL